MRDRDGEVPLGGGQQPLLTFEALVLVYLPRRTGQLGTLQHRQQTLMYADVLLLRLHHPHALLAHRVHDAEDVHVVRDEDLLQDAVQADERARSTNPGTKISKMLFVLKY